MRSLTEFRHGRALDAGMTASPELDLWWMVTVVDADLFDQEQGPSNFDQSVHPVAGCVAVRWDESAETRAVDMLRELASDDGVDLPVRSIRIGQGIHGSVGVVALASAYWLRPPRAQ